MVVQKYVTRCGLIALTTVLSCNFAFAQVGTPLSQQCATGCYLRLRDEFREDHPECDPQAIADLCCGSGIGTGTSQDISGSDGGIQTNITLECTGGVSARAFSLCIEDVEKACDQEAEDEIFDEMEGCIQHCEATGGTITTEAERVRKKILRRIGSLL